MLIMVSGTAAYRTLKVYKSRTVSQKLPPIYYLSASFRPRYPMAWQGKPSKLVIICQDVRRLQEVPGIGMDNHVLSTFLESIPKS